MASFVGKERHEVVAALMAHYDACVNEQVPHLVCLAAEAGWGKTRIVQEFYGRLQRERQGDSSYWPDILASEGEDPLRARKVIYPMSISPADDAVLPWLWWGLRCEEDSSGRKVRALSNDRVQLRAHLVGLIRATELKAADREAMLSVLGEVVGAIPGIGQAASIAFTVKSLMPHLKRRFFDALERGKGRQSAGSESRVINIGAPEDQDIAPELELVRQFISPKLPLVLIVDDAHNADMATVAFLRQIMLLRVPALVVATAWPSTLEDQATEELDIPDGERISFGGLLTELKARTQDVVTQFELNPLSKQDLIALVDDVAPATLATAQHALVHGAGGNPLVLRLQLTSPKVRRSLVDGAITLAPEELERLPRGFEILIAERYFDLPLNEQRWLAEAADQGTQFFPTLMAASGVELDEDLLGAFVRLSNGGTVQVGRFIERPVYRAIRAAADTEFTAAEREAWQLSTLAALEVFWGDESKEWPDELGTRRSICALFVRLADAHRGTQQLNAAAIADAAMAWSFAERDLDRHAAELEAAQSAVEWAGLIIVEAGSLLEATLRLSAAYRATNAPEKARDTARAALTIVDEAGGELEDGRCECQILLALALCQSEEMEAAREAANCAQQVARSDFYRIWALQTLASIEIDMGSPAAAQEAVKEALMCARQQERVDVAVVIELETELMDLDPFQGSSERWRAHAELAERQLGTAHWLHRYCLMSLAMTLIFEGALEDATTVLDDVQPGDAEEDEYVSYLRQLMDLLRHGNVEGIYAALQEMSHSPYSTRRNSRELNDVASMFHLQFDADVQSHPAPVTAGSALALLGLARQDAEAAIDSLVNQFKDDPTAFRGPEQGLIVGVAGMLLSDWFLGTGKPHQQSDNLVARLHTLTEDQGCPALMLRQLEIYEQALAILAGRVPQDLKLSPFPVYEARSACMCAVAYLATDDPEHVEEELKRALSAIEQSDAFIVWRAVASACATCRSPYAVRAWQTAMERPDASPDDILLARLNLGEALAQQDKLPEARTVQRVLLEDLRSTLGEDHVMTHLAKRDLAETLERIDDMTGARPLREEVLESRRAAFGLEHVNTLDAEATLAITCYRLQDYEAARDLEQHVLKVRKRDLGEHDLNTLSAKINLSLTLQKLNDFAGARVLQEQIVAGNSEAFGMEDLRTVDAEAMLAITCYRLQDYEAARDLEQHVLEVRQHNLGEDDPKTLLSKTNLAAIRLAIDKFNLANEFKQRSPTGHVSQDQTHLGVVRWIFT
jgi:tetratricopeptide (TPR) repeat protein